MRRSVAVVSAMLLIFSVEAAAGRRARKAREEVVQARVVRVLDGDTIEVLKEVSTGGSGRIYERIRIRLEGIDAPEKKQPFGEVCRKKLAERVAGQEVKVRIRRRDRYQRSLARVHAGPESGSSVNLLQVSDGCAWFYRQYQRDLSAQERRAFDQAEEKARKLGLGLWRDKKPVAPWNFRHHKR